MYQVNIDISNVSNERQAIICEDFDHYLLFVKKMSENVYHWGFVYKIFTPL